MALLGVHLSFFLTERRDRRQKKERRRNVLSMVQLELAANVERVEFLGRAKNVDDFLSRNGLSSYDGNFTLEVIPQEAGGSFSMEVYRTCLPDIAGMSSKQAKDIQAAYTVCRKVLARSMTGVRSGVSHLKVDWLKEQQAELKNILSRLEGVECSK